MKGKDGLKMARYFLITCDRGHCGNGHSSTITFAFEAKNLIAAMDMGKQMPSVKHTRLPISGVEISEQEYIEYRKINAYERSYQMSARLERKRR